MARQRVTINQVAEASGASAASVSLALRNKPGVSRHTRERILAAAQELGYSGSVRAGNSKSPELRNIALIFRTWSENPEQTAPTVSPFYLSVLTGIQEAGMDSAMNLLLGTIPVDSNNVASRLPRSFLRQSLDGIVLIGSFNEETVSQVLDACGNPAPAMVLVDATDDANDIDTVFSDNIGGGYAAAMNLLHAGHREIAWVGPTGVADRNFDLRYEGFARALSDHDISPKVINNFTDEREWKRSLDDVFSQATATFCCNDSTAMMFMRECRLRGVRIPDDHSVIGFDDIPQARDTVPALTTVAVDKLSMGRLAIQMLEFRLRWPESAPIAIALKPRCVDRSSVRQIETTV